MEILVSKDPETSRRLLLITNNTALPPLTLCAMYQATWQTEIFRRIKHHHTYDVPFTTD